MHSTGLLSLFFLTNKTLHALHEELVSRDFRFKSARSALGVGACGMASGGRRNSEASLFHVNLLPLFSTPHKHRGQIGLVRVSRLVSSMQKSFVRGVRPAADRKRQIHSTQGSCRLFFPVKDLAGIEETRA